jgi:hypothetical protein
MHISTQKSSCQSRNGGNSDVFYLDYKLKHPKTEPTVGTQRDRLLPADESDWLFLRCY